MIWPRVNFPNSYVHAYAMTARDGRVFDMMRVSIPQGTRVNGVDLTGWQLDRFASPRMREAKLNCVLSSCYRPVWREFSFRKSGRF